MNLPSQAEREADKVRDLPAFRTLSLPGLREQVAAFLRLIGRTETLFSTYTTHDISHIDVMLQMLDWVIPPSTKSAMTPVDWLLIVLSVYFHDSGMVVATDEYRKRKENPEFVAWRSKFRPPDIG